MRPTKEYLVEPYDEGRAAYREGRREDDNPYKPSGHERDTTYEDERHQAWLLGFWDAQEEKS